MAQGALGTHQHVEFGGLPHEVRSTLLQYAAEGEIVDIEEQTHRGHTFYEVEVEPTTQQSFRLLLGTDGTLVEKVFTGKHRQEAAPGAWG
jgi:hypothetical protein